MPLVQTTIRDRLRCLYYRGRDCRINASLGLNELSIIIERTVPKETLDCTNVASLPVHVLFKSSQPLSPLLTFPSQLFQQTSNQCTLLKVL